LCNAFLFFNAPAIELEFSALRTVLDLTFAFSFALCTALDLVSALLVLWTAKDRLWREIDRTDEWDIADPALRRCLPLPL